MTFADLVGGDSIFLDADPLVYHFAPHPTFGTACTQLIKRISNRELQAMTSTHVLSEAADPTREQFDQILKAILEA